jgi:hypothetical protein
MDNHGSPQFTPSGDFGYMGSNPEGYISYPGSYDMITSTLASPTNSFDRILNQLW